MSSLISIHTIPFKNERNNNRRGIFSSNVSTNRTGTGTKSQSDKPRLYKSNSFSSMSTTFRSKQVVDYLTPTKKVKQKIKVSYHLNNSNINSKRLPLSYTTNNFFIPKIEKESLISSPLSEQKRCSEPHYLSSSKPSDLISKLEEKNSNIKINLKKKEELQKQKEYYNEKRDEMRRIKLKLHNLVIKNQFKICKKLENSTRDINFKIYDYLISDRYVKDKLNYNLYNFRFDKNILGKSTSPYDQIIDLNDIKNGKSDPKEIFAQLSDKEKKLIILDPTYFIKDKQYYRNLRELKSKSLTKKINEEEDRKNKRHHALSLKEKLKKIEEDEKIRKNYRTKTIKINNLLNDLFQFESEKKESVTATYLSQKELIEQASDKKASFLFTRELNERLKRKNKSTSELVENEVTKMQNKTFLLNKPPSYNQYYLEKIQKDHHYIPQKNKKEFLIKSNSERLLWEEETKDDRMEKRYKKGENCAINDFLLKIKDNIIVNNKKNNIKK